MAFTKKNSGKKIAEYNEVVSFEILKATQYNWGVGFNMVLIGFGYGNLKMRDILAPHKKTQYRFQISGVSPQGNIVNIRIVPQSNNKLWHRLIG